MTNRRALVVWFDPEDSGSAVEVDIGVNSPLIAHAVLSLACDALEERLADSDVTVTYDGRDLDEVEAEAEVPQDGDEAG